MADSDSSGVVTNGVDGQDPVTGKRAATLFIIADQRDPPAQFTVLGSRLGRSGPAR